MSSAIDLAQGLPAGLATAPSLGVLGAFFPDWLFCFLGGLGLTVLLHHALRASRALPHPGRMVWMVVYPSLVLIFALTGWLAFFQK